MELDRGFGLMRRKCAIKTENTFAVLCACASFRAPIRRTLQFYKYIIEILSRECEFAVRPHILNTGTDARSLLFRSISFELGRLLENRFCIPNHISILQHKKRILNNHYDKRFNQKN